MIFVRYFASLREQMGRASDEIDAHGARTVAEVWAAVAEGEPLPDRLLCAVNCEYAEPQAPVNDGDEVAFFPQVTGG